MGKKASNYLSTLAARIRWIFRYLTLSSRVDGSKVVREGIIDDRAVETAYWGRQSGLDKAIGEILTGQRGLTSENMSAHTVVTVLGPGGSGKSHLVKRALREVEKRVVEGKRMVLHVDLSMYRFLSWDIFLGRVERSILEQMARWTGWRDQVGPPLGMWIENRLGGWLLGKAVCKIGNGETAGGIGYSEKIQTIWEEGIDEDTEGEESTWIDKLWILVDKVIPGKGDKIIRERNLLFFTILREMCILKETEIDGNPLPPNNPSRTGMEFIDCFFSLLNYISGYHPLNNSEDRQDKLNDMIDVVLALENTDILIHSYPMDSRFGAWRDHIVLSTHTDSHSRIHFPILIESADSQYWSYQLFESLDSAMNKYACADVYSPSYQQIQAYYINAQPDTDLLGTTRHLLWARGEYERLKRAKRDVSKDAIVKESIDRERNAYMAKLYKGLTSEYLAEYGQVGNPALVLKILSLLGQMAKPRNRLGLFAGTTYAGHYYTDPLVSALSSEGALYFKRYSSLIVPESNLGHLFLGEYVARLRRRYPSLFLPVVSHHYYYYLNYLYMLGSDREFGYEGERAMTRGNPLSPVPSFNREWSAIKKGLQHHE